MEKITKQKLGLLILIAISVFAISYSLYRLGRDFQRRTYLQGVNDAVTSIVNQAQQNGQVIVNINNRPITLMIKPQREIPDANSG